jgi:enterochelin esterase-like enzyme
MPLAALPAIQETPASTVEFLPATYTPLPPTATATAIAVATATPWPTDTATPLPTTTPLPTRDVIPVFLQVSPANAPYMEQPPAAVECGGRGLLLRSRFPSAIAGPWRDYHVYLPPCYGLDGRAYPVLYLFHGSIQSDSHWADLGLARYLDSGIQAGRYPPFIAVMPYNDRLGNISSGGDYSIEGVTMNELLPFVDATFCTWSEAAGRGIGGISRGGYWALMIAFRHADLFSAVSGHSSHLRLETDPARYNPLATYAEADLSLLRIWLDWGETDFLRAGQWQLHNALSEAGIAHEAHINGGGHNEAYWLVHLPEYLDWHVAAWPRDRQLYPLCRSI